jgi:hypothetical protein
VTATGSWSFQWSSLALVVSDRLGTCRVPSGTRCIVHAESTEEAKGIMQVGFQPFKDEAYLFYIRTECVPRCKHSPLRL